MCAIGCAAGSHSVFSYFAASFRPLVPVALRTSAPSELQLETLEYDRFIQMSITFFNSQVFLACSSESIQRPERNVHHFTIRNTNAVHVIRFLWIPHFCAKYDMGCFLVGLLFAIAPKTLTAFWHFSSTVIVTNPSNEAISPALSRPTSADASAR